MRRPGDLERQAAAAVAAGIRRGRIADTEAARARAFDLAMGLLRTMRSVHRRQVTRDIVERSDLGGEG